MSLNCTIYCTVIDNFGDVGVCWRLARQLAEEYHVQVTLWVDDLVSFAKLSSHLDPHLTRQQLGLITVCSWSPQANLNTDRPLDIIIEGFGCRLPEQVLAAMNVQARHGKAPLWINLEYLTAESWINDCHGMQSTHPATGLIQYFWFPGFTSVSGGLLREREVIQRRHDYVSSSDACRAFWAQFALSDQECNQRHISLFSYENPQIPALLDALAADSIPTVLLVPHSKALGLIEQWALRSFVIGDRYQLGALTVVILPFLDHDQYDHLLWSCDLNFVRGEDSLVRAHWAAKPLLWHIYPQMELAHLTKLDAYIGLQHDVMPDAWQQAMHLWNAPLEQHAEPQISTWSQLLATLPTWTNAAARWQDELAEQTDLAQRLMLFIAQKSNLPTSRP